MILLSGELSRRARRLLGRVMIRVPALRQNLRLGDVFRRHTGRQITLSCDRLLIALPGGKTLQHMGARKILRR